MRSGAFGRRSRTKAQASQPWIHVALSLLSPFVRLLRRLTTAARPCGTWAFAATSVAARAGAKIHIPHSEPTITFAEPQMSCPRGRPVVHFKSHHVPHGCERVHDLGFLVRRENELEQAFARVEHSKQGEIVLRFQKITKKTRVTGGDADQSKCGCARGRQADGFVPGYGAGRPGAEGAHAYFMR